MPEPKIIEKEKIVEVKVPDMEKIQELKKITRNYHFGKWY